MTVRDQGTAGGRGDLAILVEALPDGVMLVGRDLRLRAGNALLADMFGLDAALLRPGTALSEVLQAISAAGGFDRDGEVGDDAIETMIAEWTAEQPMRERRHLTDGRIIDVIVEPLADGEVLAVHQDVTERHAADAERDSLSDDLMTMLDSLEDGICIVDAKGRLLAFNPRFVALMGARAGSIRPGDTVRRLASAFGDLEHLSGTRRAVEAQRRTRILSDAGANCLIQTFPNGRVIDMTRTALSEGRAVVRLTDVTEVREVWRGLEVERDAVEDTRRRRAASIAQMNHELRAPLNGILGMAALLKQTGLEPGQLKFVEVIHQSGDFLLRMIEDTQSLAQLEAGTLPLVSERFMLGRMVQETCTLLGPQASEKGLTLSIEGINALLPEVLGDRQRLAQCLTNLVTNAIRYTDRGSVTVTLAVRAGAGSLDVRLDVADTGIGIPLEHQDRVFEQFYQVRDDSSRRGGVGLGLAITRGIMTAMGGTVSVVSTPGAGSVFSLALTLPIARSNEGSAPSENRTAHAS
ncbi:MAG: PAS-domain containing protein [Pseudomonadota bacterium]